MRYEVQTPENVNYADYGKKKLQEIFIMVHGVSSNMNLIWRLGVMQSNVHSHMMVELFLNLKGLNPSQLKTHT